MPLPERDHFARSLIRSLWAVSFVLLCGIAAGCETVTDHRPGTTVSKASQAKRTPQSLTPFQSDAQLRQVLRRWVPEPAPPPPKRRPKAGEEIPETVLITGSQITGYSAVGTPSVNLSPQDFAQTGAMTTTDLFRTFAAANVNPESAQSQSAQSITNTQEERVDEGDIVKLHGSTLVILRRGRLFTVSIAGGVMRPIDSINAYPPGVDARDDWYDEMLLSGDRVVVIGFSYARGGTEVNRFRIDREGHLSFQDASVVSQR